MRYIKTYEGFFDKLKSKIFPKPIDPVKINLKDLEDTFDDCFLDLIDNGFDISKSVTPSNVYSSLQKGSKYSNLSFGNERMIYIMNISKPIDITSEIADEMINGLDTDYNLENTKFKFGDIKETILFTRGLIKDKFGIDIFPNEDIDRYDENLPISNFTIKFDIPPHI